MDSLGSPRFTYTRGLHELGNGSYAYLQPDGSWGWSNAGLVVDGDQSLLVDTLFDLPLTREMLDIMRDAEPTAAASFDTLVNTHSNGDHTHGNELVTGAEIVASQATADEMKHENAELLAQFKENAGALGPAGAFFLEKFGPFQFAGITPTLPTTTFEGHATRWVGDKQVDLIQVGPAHTNGDVLVHVPGDGVVYTGDILFVDGAPIMWAGPIANWISACDRIVELDAAVVVPGHGPITDRRGALAMKAYLEYVRDQARERWDAGITDPIEAAKDIALADFSSWGDSERIVVNVASLFREFSGRTDEVANPLELFGAMAELARDGAGR